MPILLWRLLCLLQGQGHKQECERVCNACSELLSCKFTASECAIGRLPQRAATSEKELGTLALGFPLFALHTRLCLPAQLRCLVLGTQASSGQVGSVKCAPGCSQGTHALSTHNLCAKHADPRCAALCLLRCCCAGVWPHTGHDQRAGRADQRVPGAALAGDPGGVHHSVDGGALLHVLQVGGESSADSALTEH